jgi:hypothetical protein
MRLLISALMLVALATPASALNQANKDTDGGVTIRPNVSAGAVLDPGDRISFQYQSTRDASVLVFDIDTQGYVTLLTDEPVRVAAHETGQLGTPDEGSELSAEGEPGVEFVFVLAVSDPDVIDSDAVSLLREETRRINGDPFIAANMIAGELVRDISQQSVFIGYTYFYVSERVEYPCYLCGTCDGSGVSSECDGYRIAQNFDHNASLAYPLARGYDMVEVAARTETVNDTAAGSVAIPEEPSDVNFYPYGTEVYYADPMAVNLWYNWGYYDPFLWNGPYYPYYYPSWSIGFGFGWGWGYGGYYCSGWYDPWYGCGYPYYGGGYYGDGYYPADSRPVSKFKSQYKSGDGATSLTQNRTYATKSDADLRVASRSVKSGATTTALRSRTMSRTTKNPFSATHRVKTSVSGKRSIARETWANGRSGSSATVYRSQKSARTSGFQPKNTAGKSVMERSGYKRNANGTYNRPGSGAYAPSSRGKATTGTRSMKSSGSYSPSTRSSTPRSSGFNSAPRSSGSKGSSFRGGGSGWGGGSRGSTGGGSRGGSFKGGARGR